MERIGSDTRAYHSLTTSFVWDVPNVKAKQSATQNTFLKFYPQHILKIAEASALLKAPFGRVGRIIFYFKL